MTQYANEGIVAVEQLAVGGGNENAFLYLLKQRAIFLLGRATLGDVPDNVNRAFLLGALVGVSRGRSHGESAERVGPLEETIFLAATIGALAPVELSLP